MISISRKKILIVLVISIIFWMSSVSAYPGRTTMTFDKPVDDYSVGDTISITVEADAGASPITHFELRVFSDDNDPTGSQLAQIYKTSPEVVKIGEKTYQTQFEFNPTKTSNLIFRAHAWEGDPAHGGIAGNYQEISFTVTNYDVSDGSNNDNSKIINEEDDVIPNTDTPGFEFFIMIFGIALIVLMIKRYRDR